MLVRTPQADIASVDYVPLIDQLTQPQLLALMSKLGTKLGHAIVEKMRAEGCAWPDHEDYKLLGLEHKLMYAPGFHRGRLTPFGEITATSIARILGRKYRLHIVSFDHQAMGEVGWCPCGWRQVARSGNNSRNHSLSAYAVQHMNNPAPAYRYEGE